jgi:hypothetical protein
MESRTFTESVGTGSWMPQSKVSSRPSMPCATQPSRL